MSDSVIKVAVVEDHPDQREALAAILKGSPGFACVGAFASGEEALKAIPALRPDVVLMDIRLPGISGIECIASLKRGTQAIRIMMLTVFEDHDRIFQSLRAGASGYIVKKTPPAKLLEAIQELHGGGAPMSGPIARQVVASFQQSGHALRVAAALSPRESEILRLLEQGFLYKEIADKLGISFGTVNTHVARIYEKLHVHSRAQAMNVTASKQRPFIPSTE